MKRRGPILLAVVTALMVAGLLYRESQIKAPSESAKSESLKASAPNELADESASQGTLSEKAPPGAPIEPSPVASRFHTMPDGTPVPALPADAPEKIKLGVVLLRYQGTQGSSDSTRSRESALALANEITELAKKDFAEAIKKGDRGSSENIGWVQQRILERAVEHAVFSLEKGQISETPIDTPRGFWIAKRLR